MSTNRDLPDVQAGKPEHEIYLPKVGVKGVKFPIAVKAKEDKIIYLNTIATFNMFCEVEKHIRGTNMSRNVQELSENWLNRPLSGTNFKELLQSLKKRQKSKDVYVSAAFEYLIHKVSPVTKINSVTAFPCKFIGVLKGDVYKFILEANVPITTVCPCSRTMSLVDKKKGIGLGAHNQRGDVKLQVQCVEGNTIWLEDLIELVEQSGSCPTYPLLKREDEKFVTEKGYKNARFCEDVCRHLISNLEKKLDKQINWLKVYVENFESIHYYQAVAVAERVKINKDWETSSRGFY